MSEKVEHTLIPLKLLEKHTPFNAGEFAGFTPEQAKLLVDANKAVYTEDGKKMLAKIKADAKAKKVARAKEHEKENKAKAKAKEAKAKKDKMSRGSEKK